MNPDQNQTPLDTFISSLGRTTRVIDLSQSLGPGIPVFPGFPDPRFESLLSQARGDVANVEILHFVPHSGTHMDAPYHFFSNLRHVDELPVDCLIGPGIMVDLSAKKGCVAIQAADIQAWESASAQSIQAGDIVLLRTDHYKTWNLGPEGESFWKNGWPYLDRSAVEYLAGKNIKALGVETFSPDMELPHEGAPVDRSSHHTFLPKGILVMECLARLDEIPSPRCLVIALPLKLAGGSGSPVRVVAVVE
ncbi:MAG: cyclase family protein [Anaerolineaceae bacterium]|jgi:kynurenine formamidase